MIRQTQLTYLDVSNTRVTDAGLARLGGLTGLREIHCDGGLVGGAELVSATWLTSVTVVSLASSQTCDHDLMRLSRFPNLQALVLSDTQITDQGLVLLDSLIRDCRAKHGSRARLRGQ